MSVPWDVVCETWKDRQMYTLDEGCTEALIVSPEAAIGVQCLGRNGGGHPEAYKD